LKKVAILIPLVILLGVFIGFQLERTSLRQTSTKTDKMLKRVYKKELHTPKYLSEQIINHKKEYQENRPTPKDKNEEIVAYYEDTIAKEFDKNPEVYEEDSTVYVNLNGTPKEIASQKDSTPMIPKLSASKRFIAYQWYDEKSQRYEVVVENLQTKEKETLENASSYTWHPYYDVLVYDVSQDDDGHNLLKSEIYLFQPYKNTIVQLTDTNEFVETHPIFSEDGNDVYSDDAKTGRLLYINMLPLIYQNSFIGASKDV